MNTSELVSGPIMTTRFVSSCTTTPIQSVTPIVRISGTAAVTSYPLPSSGPPEIGVTVANWLAASVASTNSTAGRGGGGGGEGPNDDEDAHGENSNGDGANAGASGGGGDDGDNGGDGDGGGGNGDGGDDSDGGQASSNGDSHDDAFDHDGARVPPAYRFPRADRALGSLLLFRRALEPGYAMANMNNIRSKPGCYYPPKLTDTDTFGHLIIINQSVNPSTNHAVN